MKQLLFLYATPNSPSNIQLIPDNTSVKLTWQDNASDESGYKVYRDGKFIAKLPKNSTTYTDSSLAPKTEYRYSVKATDNASEVVQQRLFVDAAGVGDKVFIKAGLYHEMVNVTKSSLIIEGERDASGKQLVDIRDSFIGKEYKQFAIASNYYNRIYQNEIYDNLGGVSSESNGKTEIYDNLFHNISSSSIYQEHKTSPLYIYNNRFYNVAFSLRVQLYTSGSKLAKRVWFFNNTVYNPLKAGTNFMFARSDKDTIPEDANLPKIYIYHNTFVGSDREYYSLPKVGKYIQAVNNIFYLSRPIIYNNAYFGVTSYNGFSGIDALSNHDNTNIDNQGESLWHFSNLRKQYTKRLYSSIRKECYKCRDRPLKKLYDK